MAEPKLSQRELQLKEEERLLNQAIDAQLASNPEKFPKAVYFIIPNEFCERFCYHGIKNLLNTYLKTGFGCSEYIAKSHVHLFGGLVYLFPLLGAAISDSFLGKYHTIVYLSFVYLLGNILLSVFSINNLTGVYGKYPFYAYIIPTLLIALGTGGIKPCVSSHGGDQFLLTQTKPMDKFFALFYLSINVGALLSQYITPYLKNHVSCFGEECYFLAYGVPTLFFSLALALFIFGHRYYRVVPPQGEFIPWKAMKLTALAYKRSRNASLQERESKGHWLSFAEDVYGAEFVEETRLLGKVIVMFVPIIFCWVLYDQSGTEWQNQYERMNKVYFGFISVSTETSSIINSLLIIIIVPFLAYVVYPLLERWGIKMPEISRMIWGYFFIILSFIMSTALDYVVIRNSSKAVWKNGVTLSCEGCVNGTWQLPQWILLSLGEAMISPTGVQFAYTQVGRQMKASASSIWLLTTAFGNYFVMGMEFPLQNVKSPINRQWIYVALSTVFFIMFILLSKFWFISKEDEDALRNITEPNQNDITDQ